MSSSVYVPVFVVFLGTSIFVVVLTLILMSATSNALFLIDNN